MLCSAQVGVLSLLQWLSFTNFSSSKCNSQRLLYLQIYRIAPEVQGRIASYYLQLTAASQSTKWLRVTMQSRTSTTTPVQATWPLGQPKEEKTKQQGELEQPERLFVSIATAGAEHKTCTQRDSNWTNFFELRDDEQTALPLQFKQTTSDLLPFLNLSRAR